MKRTPLLFAFSLAVLVVGRVAEGQDVPPVQSGPPSQGVAASQSGAAKAAVSRLVNIELAWGPATTTAGMKLLLPETSRTDAGIKVAVHAEGAPKDKKYSLISWPVTANSPTIITAGVTLNETGEAICAGVPNTCKGEKPNDTIRLLFHSIPGEPVRIGLVSEDQKTKLFAKVVPVPLRGKDQGCTVDAVLLTPNAEVVLVEGDGFEPNAELTVTAKSAELTRNETKKADEKGHFIMADVPFVKGLEKGDFTVTMKSAKCAPTVTVPWGKRG